MFTYILNDLLLNSGNFASLTHKYSVFRNLMTRCMDYSISRLINSPGIKVSGNKVYKHDSGAYSFHYWQEALSLETVLIFAAKLLAGDPAVFVYNN